MAISDKSIEQLTKSINDLVQSMKNKNSFGTDKESSVRLGRGGSSNATDASGNNLNKSIEGLRDLHKSMKSGGMTLADHFSKTVKNILPLNKALSELEEVFSDVADKFGKEFEEIARSAAEFVKANKGNVKVIQETSRLHEEYAAVQKDVLKIHKMNEKELKDNAVEIRKILDTEKKLREEYANSEFYKATKLEAASGAFVQYMENLTDAMDKDTPTKVKLTGATLNEIKESTERFAKVNKTIHSVFTEFVNRMDHNLRKAEQKLKDSFDNFGRQLGAAAMETARRIPGAVTSRIQQGQAGNEFTDALMMGLSPQDFNEMKSAMRDTTNAMRNFDPAADTTGSIRRWHSYMHDIGLTGKEASDTLKLVAQNAFDTGKMLDDSTVKRMNETATVLQQVFKGSVMENMETFRDYNRQTYNLMKFSAAATDEERIAVEKETKNRLLLAKFMEIEVDYLKQQQAARHAGSFSGLVESITKGVNAMMASDIVGSDMGWTEKERDVFARGTANLGQLSNADQELFSQLSGQFAKRNAERTVAADAIGGKNGLMAQLGADSERRLQMTFLSQVTDPQSLLDPELEAAVRRQAAGEKGAVDAYMADKEARAAAQRGTVNTDDRLIMGISQFLTGIKESTFGPLIGAIGLNTAALFANTAMLALQRGGVADMFMRRRRAGRGRGPKAPGGGGGSARPPAAGTGGRGIRPGRLMRSMRGGPGALIAGLTLGTAADMVGTDSKTGAGLDVAADAAGWAGTGAMIGSVIPGIGTLAGGIIGGVVGGGYSLYKNRETLLGDLSPATKKAMSGTARGAAIGTAILPGIGTVVGGTIGGFLSNRNAAQTSSTTPTERNTVTFGTQTDSMNRIERDANGNPVVVDTSKDSEYLKRVAEASEKQVGLTEEEQKYKKMRDEEQDIRMEMAQSIGDEISMLAQQSIQGLSLYS